MIPNVPPKVYSLSAVVVGYLLIDDMTANEQNALGNWLMLVAQVLCTNAYYLQVLNERRLKAESNNFNEEDTLLMLKKMIDALEIEINNIKFDKL